MRLGFSFGLGMLQGVEQLSAIAERGVPVHVTGDTDVSAALPYSNHRRIAAHVDSTLTNKIDYLQFGRAFMFLRSSAPTFPICDCFRWP